MKILFQCKDIIMEGRDFNILPTIVFSEMA